VIVKRLLWALAAAAVILGLRLGALAYLETSEARYAEIAREMVESGDYITPRLDYIKHFHKPPLTYWVTALAFEAGGVNNTSGRVPLALASLGILLLTWRTAKLLFPKNARVHLWSALALFASPLYLALSRALTSDIYLALFTLAAIHFHWRWYFESGRRRHAALAGAALGLAALTKGPVVLIFFLLPWIAARLVLREPAVAAPGGMAAPIAALAPMPERRRGGWLITALPLAMFAPWLIAVASANPGLLDYFLGRQIVERVTSPTFHRGGPFYYHAEVLLAGMLFWFVYALGGMLAALRAPGTLRRDRATTLLVLYTLLPLGFFSFNKSKLPPYLLPAMPFVAMLASHAMWELRARSRAVAWAHAVNQALLALLAAALLAFPLYRARLSVVVPAGYGLALAAIGAVAFGWLVIGRSRRRDPYPAFAFFAVALFVWAIVIFPRYQEDAGGFERFARAIRERATVQGAGADYRIISYKRRAPAITFYTGTRVIQIPHDRETQFEDPASQAQLEAYLSQDPARIPALLAEPELTFLVVKKSDWRELGRRFPDLRERLTLVGENRDYELRCNR
jgi:4-amino-4-deoxy-L-arabinose transferase-like glycosyltransferase